MTKWGSQNVSSKTCLQSLHPQLLCSAASVRRLLRHSSLTLAWPFPPAVCVWERLWFPCHLCRWIFVCVFNNSCPLAWFFHSFACAAHSILPKASSSVAFLTPSSSDFHPAFLVCPSPCSCQGFLLCMLPTPLNSDGPPGLVLGPLFFLSYIYFLDDLIPTPSFLMDTRPLHLYLQAQFLHKLGPV